MKRIVMMLALAALLVVALSMSALSALAAPEGPEGCVKKQGQWVCTTKDYPGKSDQASGDPEPGGIATTTKKTQGNLENTNPEPQDVGTSCSGPPGRC
jgi:hypothetical protein